MNDSNLINPFELDAETAAGLSAGMEFGGAVELPFIAPLFWALNGTPQHKAQLAMPGGAPALYYGGWMCEREDLDEAVQAGGGTALPGLIPTDFVNREGKELPCYSTRRLILAPIGVRSSWVLRGTRSPNYLAGARQHAQVLVLLANSPDEGKTYQPWGPAVLTAKGYQAQSILDGLKAWNRHTQAWRSTHAPNTPAWAFYLGLGSFGDAPKTRMVGKSGAQSPITPLEAYLPEKLSDEMMKKLFAGRDTARRMADLARLASEWLHDWDEAVVQPHIENVDDGPPDQYGPGFEESIPF